MRDQERPTRNPYFVREYEAKLTSERQTDELEAKKASEPAPWWKQ